MHWYLMHVYSEAVYCCPFPCLQGTHLFMNTEVSRREEEQPCSTQRYIKSRSGCLLHFSSLFEKGPPPLSRPAECIILIERPARGEEGSLGFTLPIYPRPAVPRTAGKKDCHFKKLKKGIIDVRLRPNCILKV